MQNSHALKGFVLNIGGKEEGDSILVTPPISDVQVVFSDDGDLYLHWNNETMSTMSSVIHQYEGLKDGDVLLTKHDDAFDWSIWEPKPQPYLSHAEIKTLTHLGLALTGNKSVFGYQGSSVLSTGQKVVVFRNRVYLDNVAVSTVGVKFNSEPWKSVITFGFVQTRHGLHHHVRTDVFCELTDVVRRLLSVATILPTPDQPESVTVLGHETKEDFFVSTFGDDTKTVVLTRERPPLVLPAEFTNDEFVLNVKLPTPKTISYYVTAESDTQIVLKGDTVYLRIDKESKYLKDVFGENSPFVFGYIELAKRDPSNGRWVPTQKAHCYINLEHLSELLDLILVLKGDDTKVYFQGSAMLSTGQKITLYHNTIYINTAPEFNIALIYNPSRQRPDELFGFIHGTGVIINRTDISYTEVFDTAHLLLMRSIVELDPKSTLTIKGFDHLGIFIPSEKGTTLKTIHFID